MKSHKSEVTRFQARSKDQEILRRGVELDLQVSPKEIMSREVELGCESWTSFASSFSSTAVQRTLSLWLLKHGSWNSNWLCSSALVAGQWRGNTAALTLPLFWRQSTVSSVFFGRYPRSSLHFFVPIPPVQVPNKPPCFCGRKAKCSCNSVGSPLNQTHGCTGSSSKTTCSSSAGTLW